MADDIDRLFEDGAEDALHAYVRLLHPADIAALFNFVDEDDWTRVTRLLNSETLAEVLANLDEHKRELLGEKINTERLIEIVEELETDDATDVLQDLPDDKADAVLSGLEEDDREDLTRLLSYPPDSAGGLMQTELARVHEGRTANDAIEAVREVYEDVDDIHEVFVVDDADRPQGTVSLADLVLAKSTTTLQEITEPLEHRVTPEVDQEVVATLFRKYDLATLPVVDANGQLLGRITFDDVHDVIEEEASEDIMAMAGASSEDLVYGSEFVRIALFRLPWLLTSLMGTLISALLVPQFDKVGQGSGLTIILSAFVPVTAAMAGNVGSQSAMIITRGIAIGMVDFDNVWRNVGRELLVGMIMGTAAGTIVGFFAYLWKGNGMLGVALSLSMIGGMSAASGVGVVAPIIFKRLGVDPAIAAGPLVTTACDVMGLSIYLGMALMIMT